MKELVEKIVRALVDFPEEVDIREIKGSRTSIVEIKVSKPDVAYLIGKKGKNITALRILVAAAGKGEEYIVELVEENRRHQRNRHDQYARDRGIDRAADEEGSGDQ
jgi:hypothetical protein